MTDSLGWLRNARITREGNKQEFFDFRLPGAAFLTFKPKHCKAKAH